MDRSEILGQFTIVRDLDELAEAYRPLITDVGADYVAIQVASVRTISWRAVWTLRRAGAAAASQ